MNTAGWIIWGIGAAAFVCAVGLLAVTIPNGSLGKKYGRVLLAFALCSALALSITLWTDFSRLHLLWMLPVAFFFSFIVAGPRREGTVPHPENLTAGGVTALYFRANQPLTIESVRESFGKFPIEQHRDYIGVRLPRPLRPNAASKLVQMSKLLDTDVMALGFQGAMDCFEFHHWQSGRHIRSLVYGMEEERVWERADGTPEPWEALLFHPKKMQYDLEEAEDDEQRETIRRVYREARIEVGQMAPSISSKMTAETIAHHYGFPHYGLS